MSGDAHRFVICVSNEGYEVSLELRKVYQVLPDPAGAEHGMIRVVDESGEDYLFPEECFMPVEVSGATEEALRQGEAQGRGRD